MVVANNEIDETKNAGKLTTISVAMAMQRYDARRIARWRHPVASSEALVVPHRAMHLASYRCIAMAIEIARDSSSFFVAVNSLSPTTIAK